jgi:hypothetical protein
MSTNIVANASSTSGKYDSAKYKKTNLFIKSVKSTSRSFDSEQGLLSQQKSLPLIAVNKAILSPRKPVSQYSATLQSADFADGNEENNQGNHTAPSSLSPPVREFSLDQLQPAVNLPTALSGKQLLFPDIHNNRRTPPEVVAKAIPTENHSQKDKKSAAILKKRSSNGNMNSRSYRYKVRCCIDLSISFLTFSFLSLLYVWLDLLDSFLYRFLLVIIPVLL